VRSAPFGPIVDVRQFHVENGALDAVHSIIETHFVVIVFASLAPIAKYSDLVGDCGIVGHHSAALAVSAEIFAGIKTEATDCAD
jgi:hypothetical protein